MIKKIFISILMLSSFLKMEAQIREIEYFDDQEPKPFDYIFNEVAVEDGIIYSARVDASPFTPIAFITKIDTGGNPVWTTLDWARQQTAYVTEFEIMYSEDGYIYGLSEESQFFTSNSRTSFIWKVNAYTGELITKKAFYYSPGNVVADIADIDSSKFVVGFNIGGNSISQRQRIAVYDKQSMDTIASRSFSVDPNSYVRVAVDKSKSIYLSSDHRVKKFNDPSLDLILWDRDYFTGPNYEISEIEHLYIDDYDNVFIMAEGGQLGSHPFHSLLFASKLNPYNGSKEWISIVNLAGNCSVSDFRDVGGNLLLCIRSNLGGGGTYNYYLSKLDKQSGTLAFRTSYQINSTDNYAYSMAMDCVGDVYMNGESSIGSPSAYRWGIVKASGINGNKISDTSLLTGSQYPSSSGFGSHEIGNEMIFFGRSGTINSYIMHMWKLNSLTGTSSAVKQLSIGYKTKSQILDMHDRNDSLFVLRQVGHNLRLSLFGPNGQSIWDRMIFRISTKALIGGKIGTDGNQLYVATIEHPRRDSIPYVGFSGQKALRAYEFDYSSGNLNRAYYQTLSGSNRKVRDLLVTSGVAYVFLSSGSWTNCYLLSNGNVLTPSFFSLASFDLEGEENAKRAHYNDSNLVTFNNNRISLIAHPALTVSNGAFYNNSTLVSYDLTNINDTLYAVGRPYNGTGYTIIAYDISGDSIVFEKDYALNGTLKQILNTPSGLIAAGVVDDQIEVMKLNAANGNSIWSYRFDSTQYHMADLYDMVYDPSTSEIVMVGAVNQTTNSENGFIGIVDSSGQFLESHILSGSSLEKNFVNRVSNFNDSTFWIGGAINRGSPTKEGFIYRLKTQRGIITTLEENSQAFETEESLFIYPNPVKESLQIGGIKNQTYHYAIYDIKGRLIHEMNNYISREVDVNQLKAGLYIIRIQDGENIQSFKFSKYL